MMFKGTKCFAASTSAVEWYKSRAHISFLSEVIQILMCANSTWTTYSWCIYMHVKLQGVYLSPGIHVTYRCWVEELAIVFCCSCSPWNTTQYISQPFVFTYHCNLHLLIKEDIAKWIHVIFWPNSTQNIPPSMVRTKVNLELSLFV